MFSSWRGEPEGTRLHTQALHVYLKRFKSTHDEDLLTRLQELLNGDHPVMVLVHFLENATQVTYLGTLTSITEVCLNWLALMRNSCVVPCTDEIKVSLKESSSILPPELYEHVFLALVLHVSQNIT